MKRSFDQSQLAPNRRSCCVIAPPPVNPLEDLIRELLRPILKQWLDDHLPGIVDEHVKREITRITGRPL